MEQMAIWTWSEELWTTVTGLHTVFQRLEGGEMSDVILTPEYLRKLGEGIREQIIASLSPKQRLAGLSLKEIIAQLPPEELKEIVAQLPPKEILEELPPQTILAHYPAEQLLASLDPEQRLAGLDPAVIEAYLEKQQEQTVKAPRKATTTARSKTKKRANAS